jgi:hypothetical protein
MGISPEVIAKTGREDEVLGGRGRAFLVGEVEVTWHGL